MDQKQQSNSVSRLRSMLASLSAKERLAACYILEKPEEVIHSSISELAEKSGVAEATIFRLCKRLGYKGYQAFKIALARDIVRPIENIHEEITSEDNMVHIARKIFSSSMEAMKDTLALLENEPLELAVEYLANAKKIDFYGSGGSGIIALDAYHKFIRTGIQVMAHTDSHLQLMSASLLDKDCVAVGISHSGSNIDVVRAVQVARERGAKTIGISSTMKSPLTRAVDLSLYTTSRETLFRSEAMASRLVQLSVMDVLYVGVAARMQGVTLENLQKIRESIAIKRY
ncbi:MurR/RpiR family transcriptional regulator [Aneurinibacillus aneurinilyticus]|jgi:DNA-binding MurR/RpiR family transcriptional regulator|uniref:MurR/RpiR family transcriptional regulator n=2 Tax=Aneurinibacillus aneurinilyticus TaxID=1391 RepID=A0A848CZW8_ANEAE|nr:MurR/RpiR family transcriptional regulator [Aneurinibacillus aneurinilyticus]ERI10624.1 transcriptional regulator, RpiR family [Aneurinibacillus aneurinilyticus ATCC 12856]MCI1693164.1 MurR/RpiR family transcriptional regulator [Aneurinibacillus aneurinilyticus]MED0673722.1 MurR/RpiR family transcriptional regulator [Aneurinibacillus aneurinilyticus]MED0708040.1 MurR/RpiR family transcriptional regulator [Aneurinibacillus aneurinilyticus]MED0722153.1 MurR/RpiR family transcriptional regulat